MTTPYHRGLARLRRVATFGLLLALVLPARPTATSLAVGVPLVALGEAVRLWAAGHLIKTRELITSGPYRHTRNPLYLGRLLIFVGLTLSATLPGRLNLWILGLGLVVFFAYYLPRKERVEPARLVAVHGEAYEAYRRAVPALWPRKRPWPQAVHASWSWRRAAENREPWMIVGLGLTLAYLVLRSGP